MLAATAGAQTLSVSTVAGLPPFSGSVDGSGSAARFDGPAAVATDAEGNAYIADAKNDTIRKLTSNGAVTTFAGQAGTEGSADGLGAAAQFLEPSGVAVDAAGDVFVADTDNCTIRKITPAGQVTTFAGTALSEGSGDGAGAAARFSFPWGLAVDAAGNLYVADWGNSTVRKITAAGVVTTLAGLAGATGSADGAGAAARFNAPIGLAVDATGNVYVADSGNDTIRRITPSGVVTTLAGTAATPGSTDGAGGTARFDSPHGIAIDGSGTLYVADSGNATLRQVTAGGVVTTVAGTAGTTGYADGAGLAAQFAYPEGIAATAAGNFLVADTGNNTVRAVAVGTTGAAPQIEQQPTGAAVAPGQSVTFTVVAAGTNTYQWYFNGVAIAGATAASYTLTGAEPANSGAYSVAVSGAGGTMTTALAELNVGVVPTILVAPQNVTADAGSTVTLSVTASNATNYEWSFNGTHIDGATSPTLAIAVIGADQAGVYSVIASDSQAAAAAVNATVTVRVDAHLVNLSTRAQVSGGAGSLFAGFVISGPNPKQVLLRGIGPALTAFGVPGALSEPMLELFPSGAATPSASDAGWGGAPAIAQVASQVGAFPLAAGSADSALVQTLAPGAYSAEVTGVDPTTGVALAEIYDADTGSPASHLINISSRANVGIGANVLSAGFVISGTTSETVLIRAVGPGLAAFGIAGVLAEPNLALVDSSGNTVATAIGWSGSRLSTAFTTVGAFPLTSSADCALIATLPPGSYSAVVSGFNQTTGIALVEVYDLP